MTECTQTSFSFADHSRRQVVARFDGGTITSDGGGVLLRQLEQRSGIVRQFADCFHDHRQPGQVEHSVRELVSQQSTGWAVHPDECLSNLKASIPGLSALANKKLDQALKNILESQFAVHINPRQLS